MDLEPIRIQYESEPLDVADVDPDPVVQVRRWTADWTRYAPKEPAAAVLATTGSDGRPSARNVLVRGLDERGLAFFTNYESRKGRQLAENGHGALLFSWVPVNRQIELAGPIARVERSETEVYWATRPRESQIGAWASAQSTVLADRAELENRFAAAAERFDGVDVPCPPHWGGYRLVPDTIELWQGRPNRLHDRLRYSRDPGAASGWRLDRLSP
jgi:pyridoxamine 5'-phosphate oxidase